MIHLLPSLMEFICVTEGETPTNPRFTCYLRITESLQLCIQAQRTQPNQTLGFIWVSELSIITISTLCFFLRLCFAQYASVLSPDKDPFMC